MLTTMLFINRFFVFGNAGIEVFCMKDDKEFLEALESRKVPILVLDQKCIFLMSSFHVDNNAFHQPILCLFQFFQIIIKLSLDEDKRLIDEVNVKMEEIEDELIELPRNINSANQELIKNIMHIRINLPVVDFTVLFFDDIFLKFYPYLINPGRNLDISSRKLDEDKRLIDEVNVKMEEIEDELIELPRNIIPC